MYSQVSRHKSKIPISSEEMEADIDDLSTCIMRDDNRNRERDRKNSEIDRARWKKIE